jgi:hypothetical protein
MQLLTEVEMAERLSVTPRTLRNWRSQRLVPFIKVRKVIRWIQQGMRHSYCSYWLALHNDIDRLVLQSGHESKEVMWRSYYRAATKAQAEKFWSIEPKA